MRTHPAPTEERLAVGSRQRIKIVWQQILLIESFSIERMMRLNTLKILTLIFLGISIGIVSKSPSSFPLVMEGNGGGTR